jgi:hypothetical protein
MVSYLTWWDVHVSGSDSFIFNKIFIISQTFNIFYKIEVLHTFFNHNIIYYDVTSDVWIDMNITANLIKILRCDMEGTFVVPFTGRINFICAICEWK